MAVRATVLLGPAQPVRFDVGDSMVLKLDADVPCVLCDGENHHLGGLQTTAIWNLGPMMSGSTKVSTLAQCLCKAQQTPTWKPRQQTDWQMPAVGSGLAAGV